jgi:hypothetical protein
MTIGAGLYDKKTDAKPELLISAILMSMNHK